MDDSVLSVILRVERAEVTDNAIFIQYFVERSINGVERAWAVELSPEELVIVIFSINPKITVSYQDEGGERTGTGARLHHDADFTPRRPERLLGPASEDGHPRRRHGPPAGRVARDREMPCASLWRLTPRHYRSSRGICGTT